MPKAKPTQALTKWDQKLADLAKQAKTQEAAVGTGANFISLKGGALTYQKGVMPENKMRSIILDSVIEKQFYQGRYDQDNPTSPNCYAFAHNQDDLRPDPENVEEPVNEDCASCPNNEWGSADVGKGKACSDVRRLALITQGDLDDIENATMAFLKIPATSLTHWAGYVRMLNDTYGGTAYASTLAWVTEISVVKENTNKLPGWHVEFKPLEQIEDGPTIEAILAQYEKASKGIAFPYPKLVQIEGSRGNGKPVPKAGRREIVAPVAIAAAAAPKVGAKRPAKQTKY